MTVGESEEFTAHASPVMICAFGTDKSATYFNSAWLAFTGRSLEQELGDGWMEGVHPDDLVGCVAAYTFSFDARYPCRLEYRLRRADGKYRWILGTGTPRFTHDGSFYGYIASCIDTTELKLADQQAVDRHENHSLHILTGALAHDLNNLLSSVLMETDLAEEGLAEGASPLPGLRRIRTVASRAAEMARELMIYSGRDKATLERINLSVLVKEMVELLRVSISGKARLRINLDKKLPTVLASASQLRQVVMNLIINASDALGEADGWIGLTTSKVTLSRDTLPIGFIELRGSDYVRLTVSDSGCGMAEEVRKRIFEPFFTTKTSGHGLGLALIHGIVRSYGGAITVSSTPGQGATFEVLLPCAAGLRVAGHK
jgi:two-component system, cell cycle sensor histidine kinase and response regulator CckA